MSAASFKLRPYADADEKAAIELWLRTWQETYPAIDFAERVDWWRKRWRADLVTQATIVIAESGETIVGFVTINPRSHYLDQIVVEPERWGQGIADALLAEAKRLSPDAIDLHVNKDNVRAIRFYERHGFRYDGEDVNAVSGRPVNRMSWRR